MIKTLTNLFKQDKEKFVVPKGVQDVIPIKAIYDDGIFQVGKDIHSFPFVIIKLRVTAALVRFEVENMSLDHTGIPLDFNFPALLTQEGSLIPVL